LIYCWSMDVGDLIRRSRTEAGLTQAKLAKECGTSQPTIARYERGAAIPTIRTLERLLTACGRRLDIHAVKGKPQPATSLQACTGNQAKILREKRRSLLDLLNKQGASNVRLFGSVVRGEAKSSSDVDLLIDLSPRATLFSLARMRREAADLLGIPVDIVTTGMLKERIKQSVNSEAISL
jgi:uncharacterized protein